MNAQEILEKLTEAYAQRDLLQIDHNQARDNVIPEEVEAALADVDLEYLPKFEAVNGSISRLEEDAKKAVLEAGSTVKGGALQAVFMNGRVSWDSKKLDGLMIIIPELSQARKQGEPTVSIRRVGSND